MCSSVYNAPRTDPKRKSRDSPTESYRRFFIIDTSRVNKYFDFIFCLVSEMDEEASQAAYCLLAMSRGSDRLPASGVAALSTALGHQPGMELCPPDSSISPPAAGSPSSPLTTKNSVVDHHSSPFMIARILTDLTRVRQDLRLTVQPIPPPSYHRNPTNQRNSSQFSNTNCSQAAF